MDLERHSSAVAARTMQARMRRNKRNLGQYMAELLHKRRCDAAVDIGRDEKEALFRRLMYEGVASEVPN